VLGGVDERGEPFVDGRGKPVFSSEDGDLAVQVVHLGRPPGREIILCG
jgi:hypothetical protein